MTLKSKIIIIAIFIFVLSAVALVFSKRNSIEIARELTGMSLPSSDLSGEKCQNAKNRPVAVMLSSDPETRPLSGIGEADMVFEMPVTEGGVTRMMAIFQCNLPSEIGSIRSARSDFIPWVQGLGAIYAHWGGEKDALSRLNGRIVDNIDAMKYEGTYYYRKNEARPPHNGFTNAQLLAQASAKLGYNLGKSATTYQHENGKSKGLVEPPGIYEGNFSVQWKYHPENNSYLRWRGGKEELDHNGSKQVEASNVIFLKTTWSPISKDYINVKTIGSGEAVIYKNGEAVSGSWEKKTATDRLVFYGSNRQEIKFATGNIWIETLIK